MARSRRGRSNDDTRRNNPLPGLGFVALPHDAVLESPRVTLPMESQNLNIIFLEYCSKYE